MGADELEAVNSFYEPLTDEFFNDVKYGSHFTKDGGNENSFLFIKLDPNEIKDILFVRSSVKILSKFRNLFFKSIKRYNSPKAKTPKTVHRNSKQIEIFNEEQNGLTYPTEKLFMKVEKVLRQLNYFILDENSNDF